MKFICGKYFRIILNGNFPWNFGWIIVGGWVDFPSKFS
jgi:hypothetical protein